MLIDQQDKYGDHTPGSIREYWWTRQRLQSVIQRENLQHYEIEDANAGNVVSLVTGRAGIGRRLYNRLMNVLESEKRPA